MFRRVWILRVIPHLNIIEQQERGDGIKERIGRTEMVEKGTWVSIRKTILEPEDRAAGIPEDTATTPLMMWINGFLQEDAKVGEKVTVRTRMNRIEEGTLEEVNPTTQVDYGDYVPEIVQIGIKAREILSCSQEGDCSCKNLDEGVESSEREEG